MSTTTNSPKTYQLTAAAVGQYLLLVQTAGASTVSVATATNSNAQRVVGFSQSAAAASAYVPVKLLADPSTQWARITATVTAGDRVFAAAGGFIGRTTITGGEIGWAEESGIPGDTIEIRVDRQVTT